MYICRMLKAVVIFVVVCGVLSDSVPLKPPAAAEPSVSFSVS